MMGDELQQQRDGARPPSPGAGGELQARPGPPVLALSGGEPAGIGPDIALLAWRDRDQHALAPFLLYAGLDAMRQRARELGFVAPIERVYSPAQAADCFAQALPVIDVALPHPVRPGNPDSRNGAAVIRMIELATADVAAGSAAALVTCPIAKAVLYEAGFQHPGHTEFLAELAARHWPGRGYTPVMMLAADELRVVPLTIHIPLAQVPGAISTGAIIESGRIMHRALIDDFGFPLARIAVTGLNPHAGENGNMGREDIDIIAPAVAALQAEGIAATGPHSADTLFHAEARRRYDAVLAMYHDQALIPIKTLAFERGVNVTLGLPFVRTSPDHGTAFDIAGSARASPVSLIEALLLAGRLAARRQSMRLQA